MQSNDIQYVIYCRKSSKNEEKQSESIPRQIEVCLDFAQKSKLNIMRRPDDFGDFQTARDILIQEADTPENLKIYERWKPYFIITEQETGKIYGKRPKRRQLIAMVKAGKIKWILSYSPDRQARNMLEWWELINLVDQGKLSLKYSNFHFENTVDGKMMLWIWFVFSKQYSDKISVDVNQWNKKNITDGKGLWKPKYGYYRDPKDGRYKPDWEKFKLIKQAFHLRLYKQKTYEYVADRLNKNWYARKSWKPIDKTAIMRLMSNRFYFGILREGNNEIDLREWDYDFIPVITEDEWEYLQMMRRWGSNEKTSKTIKQENRELYCYADGLLISEDWRKMSIDIPSKGRYDKKLKELKNTKPDATLLDIVKSHQIYYTAGANKRLWLQKLSIKGNEVEKAIIKILKSFQCDQNAYNSFVKAMEIKMIENKENAAQDRHNITFQINARQSKMDQLTRDYLKAQGNLNDTNRITELYNKEIRMLEQQVSDLEQDLILVNKEQRNYLVESSMFFDLTSRAAEVYIKAPNVRKQKMTSIFFSNITVDNQKRLHIAVKPLYKNLFVANGADDETRTRNQLLGRQWL